MAVAAKFERSAITAPCSQIWVYKEKAPLQYSTYFLVADVCTLSSGWRGGPEGTRGRSHQHESDELLSAKEVV